ncbi:MAG: CPBP family intramembrane metalloprotease [Silvibacterium sp.]|nr:CPBP family intramembrane metalloprotease [Silvibacterium sp.]
MRTDPSEEFDSPREFDSTELSAEVGQAQQSAALPLDPVNGADPAWDHLGWDGSASENRQAISELAPEETYPAYVPEPAPAAFPRLVQRFIPNLGHVVLFFVLAFLLLAIGQLLGVFLLQQLHIFGHKNFDTLAKLAESDARISLPVQALSYGLIALVIIPVFALLWHEPFSTGVHWSGPTAKRRFVLLALTGLATGIGINILGSFLPMPKDPPIMQDMMKTPLGAWMMLIFGVTVAPMLEELAFRGFLLPGLINTFRWLARVGTISENAAKWFGVPVSIAITSLGFAMMHSAQVSHAWGPLVLIGTVSVVLCIVRLRTNSVAAGVVVHAAYNFTLFAAVLAETGGFRHLEKMSV